MTQTIPAAVIDSPFLDWNPYTNDVKAAVVKDSDAAAPADLKASNSPEPDTRYKVLLDCFKAVRKADHSLLVHADKVSTGLGLAIAKELVELHQGKIWVENGATGGSEFYVALPITELNSL